MTTIAQNTKPLPEVPYRGIESFRYIDQRVFCAREEETWDLLSNILINRGVLLYGDSGSGKSSLINAGLIPAAIKENLFAHRLRVQPRRGREIKVERISTESDDGPPYLPSSLVDPASSDDKAVSFEISLLNFFIQLIRLRRSRIETRPLLIFDQFEEFITLFEESSAQTTEGPKTQAAILKVLTRILQDERFPVKILFVFREEYLAKLNILFTSVPELLDQYVRLLPPRVDEAEEIILAPFVDDELKEKFGGKVNHVRELEHLAETIASQIQQRSENGFINLTELQIVCRKLWDSPDPAQYFQNNNSDIQKVLENYWADALEKLGDLYHPAIALLGHMITWTNTRNIISEPDLRFCEKDNFSEDQISKALNALVDSRLVRREPRHKIYFYEIVSEFLVPWIREKKAARLAQIEANKLAAETKAKLKQVEKERRYLWIGSIVLGSLLILSGYFYYRANKSYEAEKKTREELVEAQKKQAAAETMIRTLTDLANNDPKVRLDAINKLIDLDKEGNLPRQMVPFIVAVLSNEPNGDVVRAGRYFFASLITSIPTLSVEQKNVSNIIRRAAEENLALAEDQSVSTVTPRVYFQLANDSQRARADRIAAALRSLNFTVPAFAIVGNRAPNDNQLRWYRPSNQTDLPSIIDNRDKTLQKVEEIDGPNWSKVELPPTSAVRPNHYELWFGADRSQASQSPTPTPTPTPTATPTPPPSRNVTLKLTFVSPQGKPLNISNLSVSLRSTTSADGSRYVGNSNSISAPPDIYLLTVRARGYRQYSDKIVLRGSGVEHKVVLEAALTPTYRP